MRIHVVSAVPLLVTEGLRHSILGRAIRDGLVEVIVHDLRDFTTDKHRQIDDYPFGGGGGMVLKPEPIFACLDAITASEEERHGGIEEVIYLTADGERLTQALVTALSLRRTIVLLAGHYKGVDQRVRDQLVTREVSIGDYVLSGGELAALVVIDAIARLVPGTLGDACSALSDSFQDGLLGAPVYTRPAEFRGMPVPDVLLSGDHARIDEWRDRQRERITRERRPDLLE